MTRSPLFLAALASSAVPGLDPVRVQGVATRPGEQASHAQQGKPSQGGEEGQEGRPDQATASEERAGEQQDPVTGESLRPGQAESPG